VTIVMGFDQHREQITWDALDSWTGELRRGRIRPADRESFRHFLRRFGGERLEAALEATTGWRFMVEELKAVGAEVHLAEPAETKVLRGPKRGAKTDRADAKHLRELLQQGRVPESWIAPEQILELRSLVRLRRALVEQRTAWLQRIHAQLFHHGHPARRDLLVRERRAWVEGLELPHAARTQIEIALRLIDHLNVQLVPLDRELRQIANGWPGTKALQAHYGIGPLTACAGRRSRPPSPPTSPARPTVTTTRMPPIGSAATAPASRWRASRFSAPTTRCANSVRRHSSPHDTAGADSARPAPESDADLRPAPRPSLPPRQRPGRPGKTERPQHRPRDHPINHHVAGPKWAADRDKPGRPRAHHRQPALAPPTRPAPKPSSSTRQPGRRA
jgi:transposase